MNTNVRVTSNQDTGEVINQSDNPGFGFIRVVQERPVFDEVTGFVRIKSLSALVPGTIRDLERLGWKENQVLPGRIIFKEQLLPFNKKDPDRNLKIAGDTGVVCKKEGQPIYRNTLYNPRFDAQDQPVPHDNVDEIKLAYAEQQQNEHAEDIEL